ncbi:MAG: hypothetical protein ACFFCI_00560 [Promethearchaeota archaeon]
MQRKTEITISFSVGGNELDRIYDFCDLGVAPTPTQLARKALTYYLFSSPIAEEFRQRSKTKEQELKELDQKRENLKKQIAELDKKYTDLRKSIR